MAVDERAYWIWLQQAFPPGSRKPFRLNSFYAGGVREFYEGGARLWNGRRDLTDKETSALCDFSLSQAEARLEYAERVRWSVITPGCENYPKLLANIPDPPAVLYYKGELPDVDYLLSVAVVGSRKAGAEIGELARRFGYQLAVGGACVVSGGAEGVDSAALRGAMSFPGAKLISVLPVSLDSSYLTSNARLRREILERGGALVTEYFSLPNPERGTFQIRNRLITGLSRGVVLLQAAERSGTMIYASRALEQNRDVFVYPGPPDSPLFAGSRGLIADGAREVTCGEDVLAEYGDLPPEKPERRYADLIAPLIRRSRVPAERMPVAEKAPKGKPKPEQAHFGDLGGDLSPQARQVLQALSREPKSVAELEAAAGLNAALLLGVLTELEVEGFAESLPGKRYRKRF